MRVPKREDQSLFILLFNCHTSIILDLLGLSTLFISFFQNGGGGNRTLVFVGSDMRLSPNRLPNTPPIKKRQCGLGRRFPEITTALSQFLMRILPLIKICSLLYICIKITERSDDPWDRNRSFAHRDECLP